MSFSSSELDQLRRFCEVCDRIAGCRFILDIPKQSHYIFIGTLSDGRVMDEYPRFDDDDVRAFLTHYRKLVLKKEPTHIDKIINLVKRHGDRTDCAQLDHIKGEIVAEGDGWWLASTTSPDGSERPVTQCEMEDLILNGEVFHSDSGKSQTLNDVLGGCSLTKGIAVFNCLRYWRTVTWAASSVADVIRRRGYLIEQGNECI